MVSWCFLTSGGCASWGWKASLMMFPWVYWNLRLHTFKNMFQMRPCFPIVIILGSLAKTQCNFAETWQKLINLKKIRNNMKSSNNKPRNWVLQKRDKLYMLNPKNPGISKLVVEKTPEPCAKTESNPSFVGGCHDSSGKWYLLNCLCFWVIPQPSTPKYPNHCAVDLLVGNLTEY